MALQDSEELEERVLCNVSCFCPSGELMWMKCAAQMWHISVTQWQKYSMFLCSASQEMNMFDIEVTSVLGILRKGTKNTMRPESHWGNTDGCMSALNSFIMDSQSDFLRRT